MSTAETEGNISIEVSEMSWKYWKTEYQANICFF